MPESTDKKSRAAEALLARPGRSRVACRSGGRGSRREGAHTAPITMWPLRWEEAGNGRRAVPVGYPLRSTGDTCIDGCASVLDGVSNISPRWWGSP